MPDISKLSQFQITNCAYCGVEPDFIEEEGPAYFFSCSCPDYRPLGKVASLEQAVDIWNFSNCFFDVAYAEGNPHYSPAAGLCHDRFFVPKEISSMIKPCPFCGEQPEVRKCPDPSSVGYLIRCLCSTDICVETILLPSVQQAVAAWNTRTSKRWCGIDIQALRQNPAVIYGAGSLLFASGAGLEQGLPLFLVFSGACLMIYQLLSSEGYYRKPADQALLKLALESTRTVRSSSCPDAPACPLCGSFPVLHETAGGRFYVLCSNTGCPAATKLQPSQHSAAESLRVWNDEYVPAVMSKS